MKRTQIKVPLSESPDEDSDSSSSGDRKRRRRHMAEPVEGSARTGREAPGPARRSISQERSRSPPRRDSESAKRRDGHRKAGNDKTESEDAPDSDRAGDNKGRNATRRTSSTHGKRKRGRATHRREDSREFKWRPWRRSSRRHRKESPEGSDRRGGIRRKREDSREGGKAGTEPPKAGEEESPQEPGASSKGEGGNRNPDGQEKGPPWKLPEYAYARILTTGNLHWVADCVHEPRKWRRDYITIGRYGTRKPAGRFLRALRKVIWLQTKKAIYECWRYKVPCPSHPKKVVPMENKPIQVLVRLGEGKVMKETMKRIHAAHPHKFKVRIANMDGLKLARQIVAEQRGRPAVLNMACPYKAGGGVEAGQGAPEETICRSTDLMRHLTAGAQFYPLQPETALITHGVTVFRDTEEEGYGFLDEPFRITVISCAVEPRPRITEGQYRDWHAESRMKRAIRTLLEAALLAHCDEVVLSALGCGAYGHPPETVAEIFEQEMRGTPVPNVTFAIVDDHHSGKKSNPIGCLRPFKEQFDR